MLFAWELIIMGTCETGVLRCFDARHEASIWSEWLYTYMSRTHEKRMSPAPGIPGQGTRQDWCGGDVVPRDAGQGLVDGRKSGASIIV